MLPNVILFTKPGSTSFEQKNRPIRSEGKVTKETQYSFSLDPIKFSIHLSLHGKRHQKNIIDLSFPPIGNPYTPVSFQQRHLKNPARIYPSQLHSQAFVYLRLRHWSTAKKPSRKKHVSLALTCTHTPRIAASHLEGNS